MGMDHLNKANGSYREQNWPQALHHSDLAATKLLQLKDRPLEDISSALELKCIALSLLGRHREELECAKEWYTLWNTKPTDMGAINAIFALIDSCIQNKEYEDAKLYASTVYGIINHKYDNKIPEDQRQPYIADGAYFLASATLRLAQAGGIPAGQKPTAGREAIALLRRALEIHTQLYGTEHNNVADDSCILAEALGYFNDDYNEEVLRLFEQAKTIHSRVYGRSSSNVAVCEGKLGDAYCRRAERAHASNDLDRELANLELSLPHLRGAVRIYRVVGRVDMADSNAQIIVTVEARMRQIANERSSVAATKG